MELAWELIEGVVSRGLPFERVDFDTLYGRSGWLRTKVRGAGRRYMAEVPVDTPVYLEKPLLGIPERKGKRGRKPSHIQVLSGEAVRADSLREGLTGALSRSERRSEASCANALPLAGCGRCIRAKRWRTGW